MSIAATVKKTIERIPPGKIFGYEVFDDYPSAPEAVVRAVSRCVLEQRLKRLAKGRFYTPKQGLLGVMSVSDDELLRDVLFRQGQRRGYVTGSALYNRLGLTTQIPKTITVAANRAAQMKDFGTIRIKYAPRRAPITEINVPLLEVLDVLRDAKSVPDAKVNTVVETIAERIVTLSPAQMKKLQKLAVDYYNAATRALLGAILDRISQPVLSSLRASINPTTRFQLGIDLANWPQARAWNIR
ncbi:MAG: hypothetical protein ACI9DC_005421 [Gammaproteobacteria bacterium]|jgi:hypothetical protein